ncbi:MAG: hypothetical protein C4520_15280 [Candidatus Abyssobacteria bacterium SURF_5]|uniref:Uncharacterized protein n=1 Tax=Abyssobacteria bacterium (strain SURF_5) TaxID=2093360 RepID=A0A3A4NA13_ABYX5|nr:MAG: hypothetical protein C4520_15280 [Candidatus Abyssubacteria bacterium SURF_5]
MKGDMKKTILAVVLVAAAVGVVAYQILGTASPVKHATKTAIAAPTPAPLQPAAAAQMRGPQGQPAEPQLSPYESLLEKVAERDLAYRKPGFRNPMSPLVAETCATNKAAEEAAKLSSAGYHVKGIIWNEDAPLALINDQVVGIGERLDDGALITEIHSNSVKFTKRGNKYVLVLREE